MNDESVDPHLLWEMVKMKVREESIKFGASKKKKTTKEQEEIEQSIAMLEQKLSDMHTDDSRKIKIWMELETKKQQLERLVEYKTKGAIIRSKSR